MQIPTNKCKSEHPWTFAAAHIVISSFPWFLVVGISVYTWFFSVNVNCTHSRISVTVCALSFGGISPSPRDGAMSRQMEQPKPVMYLSLWNSKHSLQLLNSLRPVPQNTTAWSCVRLSFKMCMAYRVCLTHSETIERYLFPCVHGYNCRYLHMLNKNQPFSANWFWSLKLFNRNLRVKKSQCP